MAKRSSNPLAVFLLLGLAAASFSWQETSPMQAHTAPAAGCHQPGAKLPAPTPSSYRCCQLGHHSAVLQSSLTSQPSLVVVAPVGSSSSPIVISAYNNLRRAKVSSPDPPHTIPLRV